jgi:hypothetical protein
MTTGKLYNLTSNQYWGGLCKRFDKRVRLLAHMGYKYNNGWKSHSTIWDNKNEKMIPRITITGAQIMHLDNRAWNEFLADFVK